MNEILGLDGGSSRGAVPALSAAAPFCLPGHGRRQASAGVVYVVDDDVAVCEALEKLIHNAGWRTETFSCAQEFLSRPKARISSCLVLEVSLPDLSGLDVQQRLRADRINMPIVFITGFGDVRTTVRAMKAGAVEFLMKPFDDAAILSAIRHALGRSTAAIERDAQMRVLRECCATLTCREREVMNLVVEGNLNKQIGGRLGISEVTVKAHRGKMMHKMQAATLAHLINKWSMLRAAAELHTDATG